MKIVAAVAAFGLGSLLTATPAVADAAPHALSAAAVAFERGLHKRSGTIAIPSAHASLVLGDRYYFVPADEAKTILTKVWGNPPSSADGVLGIVFEKDRTIYDNVWGAIVTYEDTGYVPDKDAKSEDYDKVVASIREAEGPANAERTKGGYPAIHLVGWAQPPSYDPAAHSLIWARDLKFSDTPVDALNYDVRLLGRRGVLSLNMLSDMQHLGEVRAAATDFGKAAVFERGAAYADYDGSKDKTAEYGLAGLVAAGAGVVIAKKLGLLAVVLGFWKVILGGFAVVSAAVSRFFGRLFGRRRDPLEGGGAVAADAPTPQPSDASPPRDA